MRCHTGPEKQRGSSTLRAYHQLRQTHQGRKTLGSNVLYQCNRGAERAYGPIGMALSKLSPEERAVFVKMLQDRAAARGVTLPGKVAPEPKELGQVLTDLHKKPGQLRDMLGGDAAQPQQQASASPITDILSSPMAKAVLAGIAAMVVKRVVGR
jgi:hypothetical protein